MNMDRGPGPANQLQGGEGQLASTKTLSPVLCRKYVRQRTYGKLSLDLRGNRAVQRRCRATQMRAYARWRTELRADMAYFRTCNFRDRKSA